MSECVLPKSLDITSLTKLTVLITQLYIIIGAFVFDIDVNDAVRILKNDRS